MQIGDMEVTPAMAAAAVFGFVAIIFMMISSRRPKGSPPNVNIGIPVVGNFVEFAKGPMHFMNKCLDKYGKCFSVNMLGNNLTFLLGPELGEAFFQAKDDQLSQSEVYGFMKPVFGADVVYDAAPPRRRAQMQNMSKGLRTERLKSYVPKIVAETEQFIKEWGEEGEIDILQALSDLTILTASRCLHGDDVRENLFREVSHLYHDLDQGITPLSFFFPYLPTAAHKKRDEARKEMIRLFSGVIAARRADPEKSKDNTDILQVFIDMKYKDGSQNTDDQIVGLLIALLFAGQHTSSITSTWTTLFLAHNPQFMKRAIEEVDRVIPKERAVTFDDLQQLNLIHNSVKEALRLQPPLIMLMRKAKCDLEATCDGGKKKFIIPKGDIVITSPSVSMRLPEVFSNPNEFDPDRFSEERQEDKTWPFAYLGFGGGMHSCMGEKFGLMQVKTIVATLLSKYEIEPLDPLPEPDYTAMVVGPKGTPRVRYRLRKNK